MTVTTEVSKNGPYDPNGVTTSFAFTFKAHVSTDVRVVLVNADSELTDVSSSLYTVTINEGMGGSVVFASAPSSTSDLWILLDPDFKQEIEFTDGTRWQAKPVAKGYDRAAMRDLVLSRELARTIKVPFGQNGIELSESEFDALLGATRTPLMVTPLEYSGVGDNVADDTQAVIDALASGFSVWLPQGKTFKATADIEITTDFQRLCGPGKLVFEGNCGIVITGVTGVEIDISTNSPAHTGTLVKVIDAHRTIIRRINCADANNLLYIEEANTTRVDWIWATCRGHGIKWYGTDALRSDILDIGTAIIDPGNAEYGFDWDGNCHTLNCTLLGIVGGKGAVIRNTSGGATFPAIGRFQNVQIDYPTEHGFQVLAGLDYDFVACYILGSTTGSGLYVAASIDSRNVRVSGGKFRGNARYGIENAGGVLLTGGNLDLQDNTLGETLGDVWSEFDRVSLDDENYLALNAGNPTHAYDANDYEVFDRASNLWRRYVNGIEVFRLGASGLGKLRDVVSVLDYMTEAQIADVKARTAAVDVTAAIQAAVDANLTTTGGALYFPNGIYKITDWITVPLSNRWNLYGESQGGTIIRQFTTNKGHFKFAFDNTHGWNIHELTLDNNTQQSSAQAEAVSIYFQTGTAGHSFYDWQVSRVTFDKGRRAIGVSATNTPIVWGFRVSECSHQNTMTGAFIAATSSTGQPRIIVENNRIDATASAESLVIIYTGNNVSIRDNEWLNGAAPVRLGEFSTCTSLRLDNNRSENYNAGASGVQLFRIDDTDVTVAGHSVDGLLGTGGQVFCIYADTGSTLSISGFKGSSNSTIGAIIPFACGGTGTNKIIQAGNISMVGSAAWTTDLPAQLGASTPMPRVEGDKRQPDYFTLQGDADVTLTGASNRYHICNTTLTANRTITLPSSGVEKGATFKIARHATTPGAFSYTVYDPLSGKTAVIPADTNGSVDCIYTGGQYYFVGMGAIGASTSQKESLVVACSDETTALTTGTAKVTFRMPYAFTLSAVRASLATAQTSGSIFTVDINEGGSSILSTKLTIDNTEKTSTTAATAAVISDTALADDAEITIDIDQVGDGTAKGLKVTLIGTRA